MNLEKKEKYLIEEIGVNEEVITGYRTFDQLEEMEA